MTARPLLRSRETRRVAIEKFAPTGEGIARTPDGTGFVSGSLPGEEVEVEMTERRARFWRGRVTELLAPSSQRRFGKHEDCAGCDWAPVDLSFARRAKRDLFLETMSRLGGLGAELFGDLPLEPSPGAYRLRARLHAAGRGADLVLGYFAPRSHRIETAENCESLSEQTRRWLPRLQNALRASGASVSEISIAEDRGAAARIARIALAPGSDRRDAHALEAALAGVIEGTVIVGEEGDRWSGSGSELLWHEVAGRNFAVAADAFFQVNRHLLEPLYEHVRDAAQAKPGLALDAFGGVGFFAGALLDSGHRVVSVESSSSAVALAERARDRRPSARGDDWRIVHAAMRPFLSARPESFDLAVVDPPRAGLGKELATLLADRVRERIVYVSCEPATLARDLAVLRGRGYEIAHARLFDLFAYTHRVEAVAVLVRSDSR
ncbi:MAG TPA: TRAM domain-containing protein [Thermoanaerobaculia bacterium]